MALHRLGTLAAIVVAAFGWGCAVRSVHSYLERGVDLDRYQRYRWGSVDQAATGDPRLDHNQIFEDRVRAAIDAQLALRGFEKTTSAGSAQLLIHYYARVEQRIDHTEQPPPACRDCQPFVYDAGTLVIDLVDARTSGLLWRGWVEGNVDGLVDSQQWMDEQIDQAVVRIFERLPRRSRR